MLTKSNLKFIKSLQLKKFRTEHRLYVIEGEKSVLELLEANTPFEHLLVTEKFYVKYQERVDLSLAHQVSSEILEQIGSFESNHSALAVVKQNGSPFVSFDKDKPYLVLDGIKDPGNLGTIIRSAEWFGIEQIICLHDTVDCYNPKCLAATMGSFLRMRLTYIQNPKNLFTSKNAERVFALSLEGALFEPNTLPQNAILVLGSESHGIHPETLALIPQKIKIKGFGKAESLNVSVAAGIVLYALQR